MLAIKLQRVGKKHQPSYRFVVDEKRSKMAGPPVEDLGSYNPFTKTAALSKERVSYWIKMGAQPTLSVHNLLVAQGVVSAPKKAVKMKKAAPKAPEVVAEPASAVAPVAEAVPSAATDAATTEEPATETPTAA
jgi:small subunit ribosomal protein S16